MFKQIVLGVSLMGAHASEKLELTVADLAQINQRSRLELVLIVKAQALLGSVVAALTWMVAGVDAGLSALAGAGTYFVPNTIFALRLYLATFRPGGSGPVLFLVGEMLKIGAAVGWTRRTCLCRPDRRPACARVVARRWPGRGNGRSCLPGHRRSWKQSRF